MIEVRASSQYDTALDADSEPIPIADVTTFSAMVMYVLVRRDGNRWLAAGQNTPIRPKP
jgi:hypothetical protein